MIIEKEVMLNHIQNKEIMPYEDELVERLRNLYYEGLPLSIVLYSKYFCEGWCHHMAFQLSRGMGDFKLIRGNVNIYSDVYEPNHSWVEKDGFVYDTTDGFKWKKEIYYEYFKAVPVEIYDKYNYMSFWFYRDQLEKCKEASKERAALMVELIEIFEMENPSINHDRLMYEIDLFRENKGIMEKTPEEVMVKLKKFVELLDTKSIL